MKICLRLSFIGLLTATAFLSSSAAQGVTRPVVLMDKVVTGMPRGAEQEIRVMTANFKPGERTLFHTHRFPVTVYVLDGEFTLNLEDRREPVVLTAGQSFVEPINVKMTGYNRSTSTPLKVVIFYVSDKDTPFLDPVDGDKHETHPKR
jgi:quercetin dioxygenase-like cupin family protein